MVVSQVDSERIAGTRDGQVVELQLTEVDSLERMEFNIARTALLVLGLAIVAAGQYAKGISKLMNP